MGVLMPPPLPSSSSMSLPLAMRCHAATGPRLGFIARWASYATILLVSSALSSLAACAAPTVTHVDLPAGWMLYRGADGLVVQYPPGCQVTQHEDGAFIVHRVGQDPAAVAMVYVRPMRFNPRNAVQTARMLPQLIPDVFEGVEIARVEQLPSPAKAASFGNTQPSGACT
jgi:hypothetical protein